MAGNEPVYKYFQHSNRGGAYIEILNNKIIRCMNIIECFIKSLSSDEINDIFSFCWINLYNNYPEFEELFKKLN